MAVTSQTEKTTGIGECLIQDWQEAGLLKPSAISTMEQKLVLKKLGRFSHQDLTALDAILEELLELKTK